MTLPGHKFFDVGGHRVEVTHEVTEFVMAALYPRSSASAQISGRELLRCFAQPQNGGGEVLGEGR